jgi:hypothetical protein
MGFDYQLQETNYDFKHCLEIAIKEEIVAYRIELN